MKKFKKARLIAAALTVVSLMGAGTLLASCAAEEPSTSTDTTPETTTDTTQDPTKNNPPQDPTKVKTENSGNQNTEENEDEDNNEEQLDNNNNQNTEENENENNNEEQLDNNNNQNTEENENKDNNEEQLDNNNNQNTEENENENNNEEQLDNNNNQDTEENEDEINRKAQEIAKEIFNGDFNFFLILKDDRYEEMEKESKGEGNKEWSDRHKEWLDRYEPIISEAATNILKIPGIQEAYSNLDFNDVAKEKMKTAVSAAKLKAREEFTQQVKKEAKKIVQNEDNKAQAQQKAQESGVEEAKKFLENKIKQGINENINRFSNWSQHHWNEKILDLAAADIGWSLFIVKNSSFKHYIEEIEKIFQKNELREAVITFYKYFILSVWTDSESIPNEKVRTKVKKIVAKVFENKTFRTAFMEDGLLYILNDFDMYSSSRVRKGIEKLNLI